MKLRPFSIFDLQLHYMKLIEHSFCLNESVHKKKKHFVKTLDSSLSFEPNTNDYLQNAPKKTLL